ncbi:GntR family transcriptional regulator [Paracandidimonas soli]|uniref:DNA-binding GntR family transcriptional regulator n=1 Tax=Paracandidimonas soli TaxID=1917182 RepID=A0A4R3VH85_9BURK|nr:GntR family transcriptional regulator [Paracandidimonas soli]TCV03124.1 DNA-binding GntR family transcriptional regulator [Paracandidimonas soli]
MTETSAEPQPLTADNVTEQLRNLILNGALGVGVQLKQEFLAKQFGVSRIPVREALRRLQAEGLVTHAPHQGSMVASRSIEELLETLDIRIGLETRALVLAIPNMDNKVFKQAEEIMREYDASESPRDWAELNLAFHMCLYRPCDRPRLLKQIELLVRGIDVHLRAHQSYAAGRKSPQNEHRAILDACIARDKTLARELLEVHIEHTQMALLAEQERSKAPYQPIPGFAIRKARAETARSKLTSTAGPKDKDTDSARKSRRPRASIIQKTN